MVMIALLENVGTWLNNMAHKLFLLIDGVLCWAISQIYQIFIKLADARIFEDSFFSNFAKRIYAILGVVMLFYLAYSLLNILIDPDKATGDKGISKLARNVVVSLVILGLLPTLFDYAYKIQAIVFKENVIGAIIFGTGTSDNEDSIMRYGNYMAYSVLNPFLNPGNYNVRLANNYSWYDLKADMLENGEFTNLPVMSDWAIEPQPLISETFDSDGNVEYAAGTVVTPSYKPVISWACEVALLYIMVSFCLDLGVRVAKFAFCQLIAPIPVVMKIIPSKKGTFDKWLKLTLTVYFEVFIRVGIMYLVIYFFSAIANNNMFDYRTSGVQGLVVRVVILMGLLVFAKQAPKLISEALGLDSGNIKLGIGEKLKAGGFIGRTIDKGFGAVTGAAGAGISGLANGAGAAGLAYGLANGWKNGGWQWGKQRQDLYSKLTGDYKGKASWFGNRSLGSSASEYLTNLAPEAAKAHRGAVMDNFETNYETIQIKKQHAEYQEAKENAQREFNKRKQAFDETIARTINELKNKLDEQKKLQEEEKDKFSENKLKQLEQINAKINAEKTAFNIDKQSKLVSLRNRYAQEERTFEDSKQKQLQQKQQDLEIAKANNDVDAVTKINNDITRIENSSYANQWLSNQINQVEQSEYNTSKELQSELQNVQSTEFDGGTYQKGINDLQAQIDELLKREYHNSDLEETINKEFHFDKSKAVADMRKEYGKDINKNHSEPLNRDERKYHKYAAASQRLGEQRANAEQKKAFESVLKDLGYKKEDKK